MRDYTRLLLVVMLTGSATAGCRDKVEEPDDEESVGEEVKEGVQEGVDEADEDIDEGADEVDAKMD
jgi:hypothetical protein